MAEIRWRAVRSKRAPGRTRLATVLLLGAGVAACGGGPASPTVAHLGSTTTSTVTGTANGTNRPSLTQATKYAACMRSHGVPGFPDPTPGPNGGFGFRVYGNTLGAGKSQVQAAEKACNHFLPDNGVAPALTAAQQQAFLDWAACIRAHGLPNFSDPDFTGGGVRVSLAGGAGLGGGRGPSPQFQAAQKACKSKLPGGFGGIGG